MPQIKLIQYGGLTPGTTISPPCGKVHMVLRFKGLKYRTRDIASRGEVNEANPRGRLPALVIDGETIVDSTDIVDALDERFPDPPLMPADARARAHVKILEDWADEVLYFYGAYLRWCVDDHYQRLLSGFFSRMPVPARWIVPPLVRRDFQARCRKQGVGLKGHDVVQRELDECLDAIEALVQTSPFVVGDQMTRADIAIACLIDQLLQERLHPELTARVAQRDTLMAWLDRVHERAPGAV